jgi:chromosome partitioning protein
MNNNCITIAIVNQKGGVGKTTTTYNLGWELGQLGKRVLLVDLDSQGNLTMQSGISIPDNLDVSISNLMTNYLYEKDLPERCDLVIEKKMVDMLPANIELSDVEVQLVTATMREFVLDSVLEEYRKDYDYILIDCMPSLLMLPVNALATADQVIIPVEPELWAVKGMETLFKTILKVKKRINRQLKIAGILITKYNPNLKLTKAMEQTIEDVFGESINIFDAKIPNSVKVAEAGAKALSMREYAETHRDDMSLKVVGAYEALAREIISKE